MTARHTFEQVDAMPRYNDEESETAIALMLAIAGDQTRNTDERLRASMWLLERAYGA